MAAQIGKDLGGKVAVVTGASSGIGAASARLFAEAGARVVVGYNKGVDRANAVVAELAGSRPSGDPSAARRHRPDQEGRRRGQGGVRPRRHPGQFRRVHPDGARTTTSTRSTTI